MYFEVFIDVSEGAGNQGVTTQTNTIIFTAVTAAYVRRGSLYDREQMYIGSRRFRSTTHESTRLQKKADLELQDEL
jgi:hypothetical protein